MSDLRITIGGFFVLVGAIVGATGLSANYRAPLNPPTSISIAVFRC